MKSIRHFWQGIAMILLLIVAAGCANTSSETAGTAQNDKPAEVKQPVTLTVQRNAGLAGAFEPVWQDAVHKKYPYITVQLVENVLNDLIVSNQAPDLAVITQASQLDYRDLGLAMDVESLAKKLNFDLNQLQKAWVDMFRLDVNGKQELVALPYHTGITGLYYNKDIFDKFSVPYPKDEMTWDDTVELARRFNRSEGGTQYYALGFADLPTNYLTTQLSLPMVDEKTNKALINNDGWKKSLALSKQLFDVSGLKANVFRGATGTFTKDKNVAMLIATNEVRKMGDINWDVVTLPVWKDKPKDSRGPTGLGLAIAASGEHKDDAFLASTVMLSREVQVAVAQDGRPSILTDESLRQDFIKSAPTLEGKNAMAFFKHQPAPFATVTKYDNLVKKELTKAFDDVMTGASDLNTALRGAEERGNKAIVDAEGK
jgi:multiple sugar transport system substrate-binding protein